MYGLNKRGITLGINTKKYERKETVPVFCFAASCTASPSEVFHLNVVFVVSKGQGQVQNKKSLKERSGGSEASYSVAVLLLWMGRVMKKEKGNANSQRGKYMPRIFAIPSTMGGEGSVGKCYSFGKRSYLLLFMLCKQKT